MKKQKREQFTSNMGFILSCVGAALGLGNIWMFSYKLGKYGGAAFLIPYFLFVFVLGTTGLIIEFTFGRMYKTGSLSAIRKIFREKNYRGGYLIGAVPTIGTVGVFMFYSIVIGWILKYFCMSVTGKIATIEPESYFNGFAGTQTSMVWFIVAVLITVFVICRGVSKGIERLNKIVMPILLVLFIILTIRSLTLPGAIEGVKHLIIPRWELLAKAETWIMALGQAFFTVSLSGCALVAYGSYAKDSYDIPKSALMTAVFDTIAAILASFMIIPAVFAFGLNPTAGPALLFITVPKVFQSMPYGSVISVVFFLSIIFAAISSGVNMLEGPVEAIVSVYQLSRRKVAIGVGIVSVLCSIPIAIDMNLFDIFVNVTTIVVTPIGALIVAIVFFYTNKRERILEEVNKGTKRKLGNGFIIIGKYVFVVVTLVVIVLGIRYGGIG